MIDRNRNRNRFHPHATSPFILPIPGFVSTVHVGHRGALKLLRNPCTQDDARLNDPLYSQSSQSCDEVSPFRIRLPHQQQQEDTSPPTDPNLSSTEHRLIFSDIPDLAGMLPGGSGPDTSGPCCIPHGEPLGPVPAS